MAVWKVCNTISSRRAAVLMRALFVTACFGIARADAVEPPAEDESVTAPQDGASNGAGNSADTNAPPHPADRYRPEVQGNTAPPPAPDRPGPGAATPAAPTPRTTPTPPPASAQTPPTTTAAPKLRRGEMLFNFQDADIQAVVKTVSQMTNRNFLIDPRVKGKITIISAKPVSSAAVYQIFLSALKAQGFTAVEGPVGLIKIVPEGEGKQNAVVSTGERPRGGDQLTTQVVTVQHGSATQMVPLLRPLMAPSALLSVYAPGNTLILTDYADNVRRLLKIIERIDQPGSAEVVIIPLEHASALDMAQLLGKLTDNVTVQVGQAPQPQQAQLAAGSGANHVSIVPDLRTNSLLVRTDNQGRLNQVRTLIAKLDVRARAGGNTRVVYLRNAEAAKMVETLRGLMAGEQRSAAPQAAPAGAQPAAAASANKAEASLIQADEASNALIISAPDAVYNNLRAVIEKLDIRRAQVYVEALIAEISTDRAAQFGFQWAAGVPSGQGGVVGVQNFSVGTSLTNVIASGLTSGVPDLGSGLALAFLGQKITLPDGREVYGVGALAKALESDGDVNILSTPNLLTLDNSEAKIVIAQNVPFLTGKFTTPVATGTTTTAGVNPFATIERKDVGLTLKIKPQITEGNSIKLQISQETSNVAPASAVPGAQDITTNKRTLDTTVLVDNGFTIALGGLIQDTVSEQAQAVPFLGRIPLIGELFKYRERKKSKTNLMVFLRPVIVRNVEQSQGFTADRYEYIRNEQDALKMRQVFTMPEYPQPKLPELVQPPVLEEVKATDAVDERDAPPGASPNNQLGPPVSATQ